MELTTEERQRIYEEEQAKIETRIEAKKDLQEKRAQKAFRVFWVSVGIIFIIFIITIFFIPNKNQIPVVNNTILIQLEQKALIEKEKDAFYKCITFVQQRLKNPLSGKFQPYDEAFNDIFKAKDTGYIHVHSYFYDLNSAEPNSRNEFNCILRDAGSQWELRSLKTTK